MRKVKAHSLAQYNKWKSWKKRQVPKTEMYILAQTYTNEIYGLAFRSGTRKDLMSDEECFDLIADNITFEN